MKPDHCHIQIRHIQIRAQHRIPAHLRWLLIPRSEIGHLGNGTPRLETPPAPPLLQMTVPPEAAAAPTYGSQILAVVVP